MFSVIFPGQGSQTVGMGKELYNTFSIVKKVFKEADEKLNYPISKIILEGPIEKLQLTENTQPAIMTLGVSIFNVLNQEYGLDLNKSKLSAQSWISTEVIKKVQKHLDKISKKDKETIEILKTMQADEDLHAGQANDSGAEELESPTKKIMEVTAKIMTSSSAHI